MGQDPRPRGVPSDPTSPQTLAVPGRLLAGGYGASGPPPGCIGSRAAAFPAATRNHPTIPGRNPEIPVAAGGCRGNRIGPHPVRQPAYALRLVPGRLRARLPVLRNRPDGVPAESLRVGN